MAKTTKAIKEWASSTIMCLCGDVFQASGRPATVRRRERAWQAAHQNCTEPKGPKVFWLSFCDPDRPEGERFLGACLVEVTADEAAEMAVGVAANFPFAQPHAKWLAAAAQKAWRLGCNPGGEVAAHEVDPANPNLSRYQLGVLMDRATVERLDAVQHHG